MVVKISAQDEPLKKVYHSMMLSGEWFPTKGRGNKEEEIIPLMAWQLVRI